MALLLNNLGSYPTIEAVWADHPEGGRAGDYVTVGSSTYYWDKYSRCWVQSDLTPSGSGGSQVVGGDLTVEGNLGVGGDAVINGRLIVNGVEIKPGAGGDGEGGGAGQLVFKSIVFKRSASRPATPTDGAFGNPVPSGGWYDGVPQGTDPIWMSSRYFTNDNERPAGISNDNWNVWSTPALMSDAEDFDVEFSNAPTSSVPANPPENESDRAAAGWFDPVRDPSANWSEMKWMATRNKYLNDSGTPVWTAWKIMLIKGEDGAPGTPGSNGDGVRSVYALANVGVTPTITSQGYPPTGNVTWRTSVGTLVLTSGKVLWMSEKKCTGGVWGNWSSPIRLSGFNGSDGNPGTPGDPGADGADIEFIYKRSNSLPGVNDLAPESVNEDDDVPDGWEDNPSGVDSEHKYEWMCQRTKPAGINQAWGEWVGPFVWSAYGDKGMDGDGVEYIYRNDLSNVNATIANPSYSYRKPSESNPAATQNVLIDNYRGGVYLDNGVWYPEGWDDHNGEWTFLGWTGGSYINGEWIPTGWHDDPQGVDATHKNEYVSTRKRHDGVWGNWSAPALWATYSAEHIVSIDSDGYWCIDGVRVVVNGEYVRAEGKDGTGVEIKGSVDYLTAAQASANVESISNATSLEGLSLSGLSTGDCYIVNFVDYDSTNQVWVTKGHIYFYNGGTSSTFTDNWKDLGQFRGEPGQSQYMHLAWATNVVYNNGTPTVTGFSLTNTTGDYNWMGILVDDKPNDSSDPTEYDWNYIKGVDGYSQEFVYIRTSQNTNPGLSTGYTDSNNHTNADAEFLPRATDSHAEKKASASNQREYNDDPKGVESSWPFEWMATRKRNHDGNWGNWSTPALWAMWANDGKGIESVQDYYMLSMKSKGVTLQNTSDADWGTEYLEPTAELPYLWHYTYYEYSDGSEYTSPCEVISTYNSRAGENLLNDTDFFGLDAMASWDHKGDIGGTVPEPENYTVEVVSGLGGINAFSVTYQGSTEDGYIEYLSQVIFSDTIKKIMPATWYTLSFWQKGVIDTDGNTLSSSKPFRLDISGLSDIIDTTAGVKMYKDGIESASGTTVNFTHDGGGDWVFHTFTFKTKAELTGTLKFRLLMYTRLTNDTMQVCMPKLEVGRMATPYNLTYQNNDAVMRTGVWAPGMAYMQGAPGEPFYDIVCFGASWYRCKRSHTSASQLTPSNSTYWEVAVGFNFIATQLFLAEQATINNLIADHIQTDQRGQPRVEMYGAVAQFFGTLSTPSIEMMVDADGVAYLRFYDKDGNVLYDLGPRGISWLQSTVIPARFARTDEKFVKMSNDAPDMSESTTGQEYLYQFNAQRRNGVVEGDSTYTNNSAAIAAAADGRYFKSQSVVSSGAFNSANLADGLYRSVLSEIIEFSNPEKAGDIEGMQSELMGSFNLTQEQIEEFDWSIDEQAAIPVLAESIYMQDYVLFNDGIMTHVRVFWQAAGTANEVIITI